MCKLLYENFVLFCYSVMQPATIPVYVILFCDICGASVLCLSTTITAILIFMYFSLLKCLSTAISERICTDDISCKPVFFANVV